MPIGKKVFDDIYVHANSFSELCKSVNNPFAEEISSYLATNNSTTFNVVKVNFKKLNFSLLNYSNFENDAFPELLEHWTYTSGVEGAPLYRSYKTSLNPPILHRKELLVDAKHPLINEWKSITETAESLGLFDNSNAIGFKLNWIKKIESSGYKIKNNQFLPIGNSI